MEIHLTAKQVKLTPAIRQYVTAKLEKAQRYFDHIVWAQAFLSVNKRAHNAEFVLHAPGQTFRALAIGVDLYSAIDLASDKVDAQLKKFKERIKERHKGARGGEGRTEAAPAAAEAAPALRLEVVKQAVRPMSPGEAVEEMEQLGQAFRVFLDRASDQIHVIYRRSDESYGVLQPVRKAR